MEKFDKLFDKLNGGYLCFIILIINIVLNQIAQAYYMPFNPDYSIFTNYISDMGAGPIETKILITLNNVILGILNFFLIFFIVRDLEKRDANKNLIMISLIFGIIMCISLIFTGLFLLEPATPVAYEIHRIATVFFFSSLAILMLVYGYLEIKLPDFTKLLVIISIILGIFSLIFMIGFVIVEYTAVPRQTFVYFIEHMTIYAFIPLLIAHGVFFIRNK